MATAARVRLLLLLLDLTSSDLSGAGSAAVPEPAGESCVSTLAWEPRSGVDVPVGRVDRGRNVAARQVHLSAFLDWSVTSNIGGALTGTRTEREGEGKGAEPQGCSFTVALAFVASSLSWVRSCRTTQRLDQRVLGRRVGGVATAGTPPLTSS